MTKEVTMKRKEFLFLSLLVLGALAGAFLRPSPRAVLAQSGGDYDVSWSVVGSAGDQFATGGGYQMGFTLAQDSPPALSTGGNYQIAQGYWLYEVSAWERCGMAQGSAYSFGSVGVEIDTSGGLDCVRVEQRNVSHPNATGSEGSSGTSTGRYWIITPTLASGDTYTVNLTLPHDNVNDPHVCKYPGGLGGYGWDCAVSAADSASVTRDGITAFSDWAVGQHVGPTVVALRRFVARATSGVSGGVLLIGLLGVAGLVLARRRARRV
jgi:hypothetical protein